MSDYGSDPNPDLNVATKTAFTQNFIPLADANVMSWLLDDDELMQKFADRKTGSNIWFKFDTSD